MQEFLHKIKCDFSLSFGSMQLCGRKIYTQFTPLRIFTLNKAVILGVKMNNNTQNS